MKHMTFNSATTKVFSTALLITTLCCFTFVGDQWKSDNVHSNIKFTITHLSISDVEGSFKKFDASITSSKEDFSDAVVDLSADVNTISTDNERRDNHLKSPDFFDAAKFPTITFKSTSFKKVGDKKFQVTGNLTMHGVAKEVTFDATHRGTVDAPGGKKKVAAFKVTGEVKRSDFGISPGSPEAMLSDVVTLTANLEFVRE